MENQIYVVSGTVLVYLMFFIGAIGCFLPVIPGVVLAAAALAAFKALVPEAPISWTFAIVALALSVLAQALDFILSWYGARRFGATRWGAVGAFVGVFVGAFIPPQILWIFLAPVLFAFAFEYVGGASARQAAKAGFGTFAGTLAAALAKFLIVVFMAAWFTVEVVSAMMSDL